MDDSRLIVGGHYKHFKNEYYTVIDYPIGIATNNPSDEEGVGVLYRCDSGKNIGKRYVREVNEFLSEVDKDKYPLVTQKYRFELLTQNERNDLL